MAKGLPQLQKFIDEFTTRVYKPAYKDPVCLVHTGNTDGWFKVVMTFCNPGEGVLAAEWTYPSAMNTTRPLGVTPVPVPIDEQGICGVGLRKILAEWDESARGMPRPRIMYTVPIGQNPTGATMEATRKKEIYEICVEFDVVIVEDDPYYFLQEGQYTHKSSRSISRTESDEEYIDNLVPSFLKFDYQGRVIRLDSFSKTVAPGCRLGWFTCNPLFAERLERQAESSTQAPCGLGQTMVTSLILNWQFNGYIRWLRALGTQYTQRRDFLLDCFSDEFHLEVEQEHKGAWKGNTVYRAYAVPRNARAMIEKTSARAPMFSFVPPTSGMFVWMQLHLNHHPAFPDETPVTLEMKLWEKVALAGVLFAPGRMFSCEDDGEASPVGSGHFRVSFSNVPFDTMKQAVGVFATEIRKFWVPL
ncbi:hypothetical protein HGRIS_009955 [Hohenbuehelia grisea]|uniref:Aminotransferase class I/classII large domain-containing protein n=2 Tax=Hohenbuehelia grisea TaxID=104357 RepID=A0ABR3J2T5_9AGAR